jgi:hypothetical protein
MVLDGPMDGETFLAYVRTFLCPTLTPGDIPFDKLRTGLSPITSAVTRSQE